MSKKITILFIAFVLFFGVQKVNAECNYEEKAKLNREAANIKVKYALRRWNVNGFQTFWNGLDWTVLSDVLVSVIPALVCITLHELAHGYVALRCGDPTAQMMGRLSFNPLRHLNLFGTICMFLFGVGWANPVPVNPRNFRSFRRDDFLVSIAGIVTNLLLYT